jgi:large subunit ribosomal protein L5
MTETEMSPGQPTETEMTDIEATASTEVSAEPMAATEAEPMAATEAEPMDATDPTSEAGAEAEGPKAAVRATKPAKGSAPAKGSSKAAAVAEAPAAPEAPTAPETEAVPAEAPAPASRPRLEGPRGLRQRYATDVVPALVKQFEYANPNQVPKLEKIVVNVGLGEALSNAKAIDAASGDLTMITGQKPIVTRARRSIAQFKIRTGNPIGLKVTLRGQRMWDFLERLTLLTLPRIRDFRGVPSRSFDGRGNYSLGMREQIAFPEIDYDKVDRLRGLEVSIVTTAKSDEESKRLLELLGMPFAG